MPPNPLIFSSNNLKIIDPDFWLSEGEYNCIKMEE